MNNDLSKKAIASLLKLRIELNAVRWALWNALDGWEKSKPWGVSFGGPETTQTDVGIALVREGRRMELDRERRCLNEPMQIEKELAETIEITDEAD